MENSVENEGAFVDKLAALIRRKSDKCPICGACVKHLIKLGEYIHSQPCNCRLWQGNLPASWWGREPGSK